jgi:phage/plasmid-like protein (TIGR03299 family)
VPWHGQGARLEEPADLATALARGGLDWTVSLRPIVVDEDPPSSTGRRVAVVRDDIAAGQPGRVLGIVHPDFRPLQNAEGAGIFDRLFDAGANKYVTGGYLGAGERVWLQARLPQDLVIAVGKDDTVDTYLLYSNSHDGSQAVDMRIGTVRVVCQNTLNLALSDQARWALRRAHDARLAFLERDAREFFRAITGEVEAARRSFAALHAAPMDDAAFRAFLQRLLPMPARPAAATPAMLKAWHTRCAGIESDREALAAIREEGGDTDAGGLRIEPAPPTKWGALNAVTAWIDHFARPERSFAFATFGQGAQIKDRAYQLLTAAQPAA